MTPIDQPGLAQGLAEQRTLWRGQASSIPSLLGGKAAWFPLVLELVKQIGEGRACDLDARPSLSFDIEQIETRPGGAVSRAEPATWLEYYVFLRSLRLAENIAGRLQLTETGLELQSESTPERLATILADRIRLFAEVISVIAEGPITVEDVDEQIRLRYGVLWQSKGGTRSRMNWQEVLGLIEPVGNRRWQIASMGRMLLDGRVIVTPQAIGEEPERVVDISKPPGEIAALLDELSTSARSHESRSTYNIWVPSPPSNPNKVENLRTVINAAQQKIERNELFSFICQTFDLKRSSVESMLPFLRASGTLVEVGRGVFQATPEARAWIESEDDLNFVRILHANMRFVGELIRAVKNDVTRNEVYSEARNYELNTDKCRWIVSFLLDTGLIDEPRYGSLRATPRGLAFMTQLPLAEIPGARPESNERTDAVKQTMPRSLGLTDDLNRLAREPLAGGESSGRAFENAVCDVFLAMGFEARVISGSGDTDVVLNWREVDGSRSTAIIEAKARSVGHVTHTDISDVAIETHKDRHQASFVAIVGPSFSGETIRNMASQKQWVLLDADRLRSLADASIELGLRPYEVGRLFLSTDGLSELDELIVMRRRELEIVTFLLAKLVEEEHEAGEPLSARDISRDGRRTELAPSVDEILAAIETMSRSRIDALRLVDRADDPKFATYVLGDAAAGARRLRALADAIERRDGVSTRERGWV